MKPKLQFTKKERYGILGLSILIIAMIVIRQFMYSNLGDFKIEFSTPELEKFKASLEKKKEERKLYKKKLNKQVLSPFRFDPNKISRKNLLKMGFSEKQTNMFLKFRGNRMAFSSKEELKNLYFMNDELYEQIENFVSIEKVSKSAKFASNEVKDFKKKLCIHLNEADTMQLMELPGIGISFAGRIIKYRNLLGGYYKVEQLLEVFGMDSSRYNGIKNALVINTDENTRLDINHCEYKELLRHPYVSKYEATVLMDYRKHMQRFESVQEIMENKLMKNERFKRLQPYLIVSDSNRVEF